MVHAIRAGQPGLPANDNKEIREYACTLMRKQRGNKVVMAKLHALGNQVGKSSVRHVDHLHDVLTTLTQVAATNGLHYTMTLLVS